MYYLAERGRFVLLIGLILVLAIAGCKTGESGGTGASKAGSKSYTATALGPPSAGTAQVFSAMTAADSGFDFTNSIKDRRALLDELAAQAGGAAADYDNDGDIDFFISGLEIPSRLYRNDGAMKFSDVTAESGIGAASSGTLACGATFADIDGDKDLDLYVGVRKGANLLFINDGSGKFTEEAKARGVNSPYATITSAVFDADNDGDLDMYLANYREGRLPDGIEEEDRLEFTMTYAPKTGKFILPADMQKDWYVDSVGKMRNKPHPDQLFINDGSGKFTDHAEEAGLSHENNEWSLQALPCDFNDDGLVDILVGCDFDSPDYLYINQGDGTFKDEAADRLRVTSFFSMGSDAGDLNGDGLMDAVTGDMLPGGYKDAKKQSGDMRTYRQELMSFVPQQQMRNAVFINRGEGWMSEAAEMTGLKASEWTWTVRIADLNCDGLQDVYCSNGFISKSAEVDAVHEMDKMRKAGRPKEEIDTYRLNLGSFTTDDVIFTCSEPLNYSKAPDNWGMKDQAISCGVLLEDFDGDGDQDMMSNNTNSPSVLWRNDVADGNRVVVALRDDDSRNTRGIGAKVTAWCGEQQFANEVILSRGWATGCSGDTYIGLGKFDKIDKLVIRWPDMTEQNIEALAANMKYVVTKPKNLPKYQAPAAPKPAFSQQDFDWEQKEQYTGDNLEFVKEALLPAQRSELGTGCSVADFNGDGSLDVYFCHAAGGTGALFNGDGKGGFSKAEGTPEFSAKEAEEMGALAYDANADSKPDLLLTLGSNENPPSSPNYLPRLVANAVDGLKPFIPEGMFTWSAGSAAAADLNGDGNLEILICGRQFPFAYMKPAFTKIYESAGKGKFTDATAKYSTNLERVGVVADGQFADLNGDGKADLVLALEYGPLAIFMNENGKLTRVADAAANGLWQSLGIGDFDNDGDQDILAGNMGWNSKYHPKDLKPTTLICDDFDKNGVRDVVEVKWRDDGCALPGRGRSCSGYAISYIPKKFPTWTSFADATFEDIYGPMAKAAERYDATQLRSQILLNDGSGKFTGSNLPVDVQFSIAEGIGVGDFNCDGNLDAYVAQNFHWPQPETGRWITGYGVVLMGKGDGSFDALSREASGISFPKDARGVVPADFNGDGMLDIVFSASDAKPQYCSFNGDSAKGSGLLVTLKGKAPNTQAVGAKLVLETSGGKKLTRFVQAGSGMLSSYYGPQHFGVASGDKAVKLTVTWPDGSTKEVTELAGTAVTVEQ